MYHAFAATSFRIAERTMAQTAFGIPRQILTPGTSISISLFQAAI